VKRWVVVAVLMLGLAAPARAQEATTALTVDASTDLGSVNRDLVGFGWHRGGAPLAAVQDLQPKLIRVDASLQDVSPAPGVLELDNLLGQVAEVRAIGAEPLVILCYMPAWLGEPRAFGRDPTKVPPADMAAWERLVHDVVTALATAPAPARRFEAWNEPDVPIFWQDTPEAWADTVTATGRAIARVERETGLDLAFGGPATAFPDPVYLATFLNRFRDPALPLDFVSWHYYGNLPFFGPDGTEFAETEPIQPIIGQRNPVASPSAFGPQVELMRQWTAAALAGADRPGPELFLDEWNLSSGGFDRRHDSHEGAAFAAGVLTELQEAGLDASAYFRANNTRTIEGDHGLVFVDGQRKPAWWTFWLWQRLADRRVAVTGADEGVWAVAATDTNRLTLLVSSFSASRPEARTIDVAVTGLGWMPTAASVRRVDAAHADAAAAEPVELDGGHVRLDLPAQAVALIELHGSPPAPNAAAGVEVKGAEQSRTLPATGGGPPALPAAVLGLVALSFAGVRRSAAAPAPAAWAAGTPTRGAGGSGSARP
jgi:hypothetical protein